MQFILMGNKPPTIISCKTRESYCKVE